MRATLDHIVLNVRDVEKAVSFYTEVLGFSPERLTEFRAGTVLFPSVRLNDATVIDLAPPAMWGGGRRAGANLDHFCLCIAEEEWPALERRLEKAGAGREAGPMTLWGARGDATAYYYKDPEGNRFEIRFYAD